MKTVQTSTHLLLVDETADLGINKPFYGYCWNWWDKVHYFNRGLNEDARGRNGIQKIIAASPKLGDLPEFETLSPNTGDDVELSKLTQQLSFDGRSIAKERAEKLEQERIKREVYNKEQERLRVIRENEQRKQLYLKLKQEFE